MSENAPSIGFTCRGSRCLSRVRVRVSWVSGYKNQIIEEIGRNMYCIYIESMLLCVRVMGCLALPYAIRPGV